MKKLWNWLSGKKRTIAEMYWGLWIPIALFLPSAGVQLPTKVTLWSGIVGLLFTYLGLGHAAIKAQTIKKAE